MTSDSEYQTLNSDNEEVENKRELNIIIFGESGVGKSALINQVHDQVIVESSSQAIGCTVENAKVSGTLKDYPHLKLNVYDTAGLSESADGSLPTAEAFVQLIKLSYAIPGGIHLLICCHGQGRLSSEQFKANYRIFKEELCENRIPCLLVITHCDNDKPLNAWWINNQDVIRNKLKFQFIDGICVSTVRTTRNNPNEISTIYTTSRRNLIQAIAENSLSNPHSIDSWKRKVFVLARVIYNKLASWLLWLGFKQVSLRPELEKMFIDLKFSPEEAKRETEKLLKELEDEDLMGPYREYNV